MKLGPGSHRRMPAGCWGLAILAAALILLGAAGGLAQMAEAQEQVERLVDAYPPAELDRHVQQASHEAVARIAERASSAARSDSVTRIYAVADVLAKMKREENWTDVVSDEQVKQAFIDHLRPFSLQVTIEVRIMQSSLDLCAQDVVDATATPEDGSAFWKNRWVLFQQDFATAVPTLVSQLGTSSGSHSSAQGEPTDCPSARVTTGTSDPIVHQFLDDELFRAFLNHCQGDEGNAIVLAPKVTLFDGQIAEISDCSERPFVTDVTKVVGDGGVAYQPVVQVLWEGTRIQLAPTITPEGHRVKCRFRFASIDDCKTFRPSRYPEAEDVLVQHPVVTTASLECAIDIPAGQTLLIGGLFPRQVERNVKQGAINRLLGRQATEITSEATYIAITPRKVNAEATATQLPRATDKL